MKIGLVTLHHYNYGSALQCFATQTFVEQQTGADVEVIDEAPPVNPLAGMVRSLGHLALRCMTHPRHAAGIVRQFLAQRSGNVRLSRASTEAIGRFNATWLHRAVYTPSHLRKVAATDAFALFFSGSDQVWNGARIDRYAYFFLRFAPRHKRIGWAASIGSADIAPYNRRRYRRYLSEFARLSLREASGVALVWQWAKRPAAHLPDPVLLLGADAWRRLMPAIDADADAATKVATPYVLAFFIDRPSAQAVRDVGTYARRYGLGIVTVGYRHAEWPEAHHIDGDPFRFLAAIDGADCVMTDSFHAVAFATLLHRPFYAFARQYAHSQDQSARLIDFLADTGLAQRFNAALYDNLPPDFTRADRYIALQRQAARSFLGEHVPLGTAAEPAGNAVRPLPHQCCACGACADVCRHGAITLSPVSHGHVLPVIDTTRCTGCGACRRVCAFCTPDGPAAGKAAFIAACTDAAQTAQAASGGIFAALAGKVLAMGGVAYGACLWVKQGRLHCVHRRIDKAEDLPLILGSKYVHSRTQGIFARVRADLMAGRQVVFGGTSCQVAALKAFLRTDYPNLLTTDLICHGVPDMALLQQYVDSMALKDELTDFRFRIRRHRGTPYVLTLTLRNAKGRRYTRSIGLRRSAFYRLYMACGGYRPACYACPFATTDKPADLTLGDFSPADAPKDLTLTAALGRAEMLSTVITHTPKGRQWLDGTAGSVVCQPIGLDRIQAQHAALRHPSTPTRMADALLGVGRQRGFRGMQRAINGLNAMTLLPAQVKRLAATIGRRR